MPIRLPKPHWRKDRTSLLEHFGAKPTAAAWHNKPSWYIVASNDNMISPEQEESMAKQMSATITVLPASHAVMLSHPKEVATVIEDAAAGKKMSQTPCSIHAARSRVSDAGEAFATDSRKHRWCESPWDYSCVYLYTSEGLGRRKNSDHLAWPV